MASVWAAFPAGRCSRAVSSASRRSTSSREGSRTVRDTTTAERTIMAATAKRG